MGTRGPIRKPASERQGHRARSDEPALSVLPTRTFEPPTLSHRVYLKPTRDAWDAYFAGVVSQVFDPDVDLPRLYRWAEYLDLWHRTRREVRDLGVKRLVTKGSQGQLVQHPFVKLLLSLEDKIAKAEAELGLTPLSRARLQIDVSDAGAKLRQLQALAAGGLPEEEEFDVFEATEGEVPE